MHLSRILILSLALLAGCEDTKDVKALKEEVTQLQVEIAQLSEKDKAGFAAKRAELDEASRQAAVAGGCRALVNLCPSWLTQPGDRALAAGAGPGDTWLFWGIYLGKFGIFLLPLLLLMYLWLEWFGPRLNAGNVQLAQIREAREAMQTEQEEAARRTGQARDDLVELNKKLTTAQTELERIDGRIKKGNEDLESLDHAIQKREMIAKSFNLGKKP
jgi:outer membrane murein-binding lipoprotein Lpp